MELFTYFKNIATIFKKNGFNLFMIGGTSRDYLLKVPSFDYDFVSDATPSEMSTFLPNLEMAFAKFGTVFFKDEGRKIEITTLRKEGEYKDFRHPTNIVFVKDIKDDYLRRDFTINAIYIDMNGKIHDFANGLDDLKKKIIRTIGDSCVRFKEDPLRILRALRFAIQLDFTLAPELKEAIKKEAHLVDELNPFKVEVEVKRMKEKNKEKTKILLEEFNLGSYF